MAETTGLLRLGALALLLIATILSQASTLHAQASEPAADHPENSQQTEAKVEGVAAQPGPETGTLSSMATRRTSSEKVGAM